MRLTPRVAVGVALVCGLLAAVLVYLYLKGLKPETPAGPPQPQQVAVVMPSADIPANTVITADKLRVEQMPFERAPRSALRSLAEVTGSISMQALPAGKPILEGQVLARGPALGLAGIVPPGMRAVTVPVDPVTGVAGLLKAGDRVDVVASFEAEGNLVAKTVLQDIEVLALGMQTIEVPEPAPAVEAPPENAKGQKAAAPAAPKAEPEVKEKSSKTIEYPNATLSVTPDDANKLVLVAEKGKIRLVLRPIGDHDYLPVAAQDMSTVLGPAYAKLHPKPIEMVQPPAPSQPSMPQSLFGPMPLPQTPGSQPTAKPTKKPNEVEVIRGGAREQIVP